MQLAGWLTASYILLTAQTSLCPHITIADWTPQALWLGLIVGAMRMRGNSAICWGTWIGLLNDCLTPYTLGIGALTGLFLSAWIQQVREREWQSLTGRFLLTFLVVVIGFTLPAAIWFLNADTSIDWLQILSQGGGIAVYTALLATVLLILNMITSPFTGWNIGSESVKDANAYRWRMLTD